MCCSFLIKFINHPSLPQDEDYVPEEDDDNDYEYSEEEYDDAPDEGDGGHDEGDMMFYPGVMSTLGKIVDNLRQQQQTASDPAWAKAGPFLRFIRDKIIAAGVLQLPPYMSRPVTRSSETNTRVRFGLGTFSFKFGLLALRECARQLQYSSHCITSPIMIHKMKKNKQNKKPKTKLKTSYPNMHIHVHRHTSRLTLALSRQHAARQLCHGVWVGSVRQRPHRRLKCTP